VSATRAGVTNAFDHNEGDFAAELMRVTGGHGADVVVEFIGAATWERSVRSLALHGRLVCCGAHTGVDVGLNLGDLFARQYDVIGSTRANRAEMETVVCLVTEGKLRPKIERRFRLDEVREAHRLVEQREQIGKFVLLP
jgi:alcohol dehydrogenase